MRNRRRKKVEIKKRRKRTVLFTIGVLIVIYFFLTLVFGENGLLRYIKLRSIRTESQADIKRLKKQNKETKRQIDALKKDPDLLEELARKQGLAGDEELIFKFEDDH